MKIADVVNYFEQLAPSVLQESYDNAGLICGDPGRECTGMLTCLDSTPAVITEAIQQGCNLIVAHHPIIFSGIKKLNGKNYIEEAIILAVKNDIAILAVHTNLDNVKEGVNKMMADKIGLINRSVLAPKPGILQKLYVFVPHSHAAAVQDAMFAAGAGAIGNYSECSFSADGRGSFKAGQGTEPFVGEQGVRHNEQETRIEVILPSWLSAKVLAAMRAAHPYEEVAYDLVNLANAYGEVGAGLAGELPAEMAETDFLRLLKQAFGLDVVRHTALTGRPVKRVALCGGAGSFLIFKALGVKADVYVTADIKYHEFFDANGRMMICDIGHFESEQFTVDLLYGILREKFPNFAVLKTKVRTNPVHYFF
ncbi:MAG: Nif3-like dinuclear metal center hexameric protein [Chitinophagaceae bacterium]|nr:MAG: Nif3-like dinuclear metal center hexameric protein [Chitinophagaceae bacterium]